LKTLQVFVYFPIDGTIDACFLKKVALAVEDAYKNKLKSNALRAQRR
jgi:hypothetical protein